MRNVRVVKVRLESAWLLRAVALGLLFFGVVASASHGVLSGLIAFAMVAVVMVVTNRQIDWRWHTALLAALAAAGLVYLVLYADGFGWTFALVVTMRGFTRLPLRAAVALVGTVLLSYATVIGVESNDAFSAMEFTGGLIGIAALGNSIRQNRENTETLARLLESEQRSAAARAAAEALAERQRLARELHDVLGHTLSAQILRLEGVQLLLQRGAEPAVVLEWVEQAQKLARDGLAESKDALASLRGASKPAPEAVRELAAEAEASFEVDGEPRPLTPEVGLAVRRVAQEALTNVRRHAPGASVDVRLGYADGACTLEVVDGGAAPGQRGMEPGSGYGLTGMQERAELLGGKLEAGPCGSGFRVRLWIPT
jgi:signal transduction histidine kinase